MKVHRFLLGSLLILTLPFTLMVCGSGGGGSSTPASPDEPVKFTSASYTTFADGIEVTVNGSGYGTVRTADYWDVFDDYATTWECGINQQSCASGFATTGTKWTNDGGWSELYFNGDKFNMTLINGDPLLHMDSASAQYSTGYGFTVTAEYYTGGSGGLPNSGISWNNTTVSEEVYVVYYLKYDASWTYPYKNVISEKHAEIFLSDGTKIILRLRDKDALFNNFSTSNSRFYFLFNEVGGDNSTIDIPTTDGEFPIPGTWHELKFYLKMNTPGSTDGIVKMWLDGVNFINDSTADIRGSSSKTFGAYSRSVYFFGNIQHPNGGSFTAPGAGNEWDRTIDDVWVWTTNQSSLDSQFPLIPIVYLSNSSSFGSGPTDKLNGDSEFVRQKVGGSATSDLGFMSWTDTQMKFQVVLGAISISSPVYLYVTNWSGETNSTGYLVYNP